MLRRALYALRLLPLLSLMAGLSLHAQPTPGRTLPRTGVVSIETAKTSIYVGHVTLTMNPFVRRDGVYTSVYDAKVFPFFFFNEHGRISIDFPDSSMERLLKGETVSFSGHATNSAGHGRRVDGRAVPDGPAADHGKIKVNVWVGRVQLVFHTTYRFGDAASAAAIPSGPPSPGSTPAT